MAAVLGLKSRWRWLSGQITQSLSAVVVLVVTLETGLLAATQCSQQLHQPAVAMAQPRMLPVARVAAEVAVEVATVVSSAQVAAGLLRKATAAAVALLLRVLAQPGQAVAQVAWVVRQLLETLPTVVRVCSGLSLAQALAAQGAARAESTNADLPGLLALLRAAVVRPAAQAAREVLAPLPQAAVAAVVA